MQDPGTDCVYIVTDIEVDGPWPGPNSMRSFASVALTHSGQTLGEFEGVLESLPGAAPNPDTYAWFQTQPEAWAAATTDPTGRLRRSLDRLLPTSLHLVRVDAGPVRVRCALSRRRNVHPQLRRCDHPSTRHGDIAANPASRVVRRHRAHPPGHR